MELDVDQGLPISLCSRLIQSQLDDLESGIEDMTKIMSETQYYITAQQSMMRRCSQRCAALEVICLHLEVETEGLLTQGQQRRGEECRSQGLDCGNLWRRNPAQHSHAWLLHTYSRRSHAASGGETLKCVVSSITDNILFLALLVSKYLDLRDN